MISSKQFASPPSLGLNRRHAPTATTVRSGGPMPLRPMKTDASAASEPENVAPNADEIGIDPESVKPHPTLAEANSVSESDENDLVKRITSLWSAHTAQSSEVSRSREQLRTVRLDLGRELSHYKERLAITGRGGKWTSFLRERKIPRATADRYVKVWEETQKPEPKNCVSDAIPAPTAEQIQALVKTVCAKLRNRLTTPESRKQFIDALALGLEQPATSSV